MLRPYEMIRVSNLHWLTADNELWLVEALHWVSVDEFYRR